MPPSPPLPRLAALSLLSLSLIACGAEDGADGAPEDPPTGAVTAFTGMHLFDGTGGATIPAAVLLVREGRVVDAGPAQSVPVPEGAEVVSLDGRWVVPGFVNGHGHVGTIPGLPSAERYTRELLLEQLLRYARYGITTVASLGGDGAEGVALRDEQEGAGAGLPRARLFVAGPILDPGSVEEIPALFDELEALGVDWAKIRVDDFRGAREAMSPEIYGAIIREAHARGLPLAAHMVRLEDARGLLDAGADLLAHSVRDRPVDAALIEALRRTGVCLSPTLTRELSTFIFAERPDFFDDPFFRAHSDSTMIAMLDTPESRARFRESAEGAHWRERLPIAEANAKALADAGIPLAFGTDSGPFGRFQGFFEHLEMEWMVDAGLTPRQVLLSATRDAARCLHLDEVGTLERGKRADFVVLEGDPLEEIRNTRRIVSVRVGGTEIPGAKVVEGGA